MSNAEVKHLELVFDNLRRTRIKMTKNMKKDGLFLFPVLHRNEYILCRGWCQDIHGIASAEFAGVSRSID